MDLHDRIKEVFMNYFTKQLKLTNERNFESQKTGLNQVSKANKKEKVVNEFKFETLTKSGTALKVVGNTMTITGNNKNGKVTTAEYIELYMQIKRTEINPKEEKTKMLAKIHMASAGWYEKTPPTRGTKGTFKATPRESKAMRHLVKNYRNNDDFPKTKAAVSKVLRDHRNPEMNTQLVVNDFMKEMKNCCNEEFGPVTIK